MVGKFIIGTENKEELQWKNKSVHSEHKNLQTEYRYKINKKK